MKCDFCGSVENGELRVVQDRLDVQYLLCGKKLPSYDIKKFRAIMTKKEHDLNLY